MRLVIRLLLTLLVLFCCSQIVPVYANDVQKNDEPMNSSELVTKEITSEQFKLFVSEKNLKIPKSSFSEYITTPASLPEKDNNNTDEYDTNLKILAKTQLPVRHVWQHTEMWCWAASIQMILNYHNIMVSQEDIVFNVFGRLQTRGANDELMTIALNRWIGPIYGQRVKYFYGIPDTNMLINHINSNNPVIVVYDTDISRGLRHAVVISGVNNIGNTINSVVVHDPFPSKQNLAVNGRLVRPANFLYRNVSYWYL